MPKTLDSEPHDLPTHHIQRKLFEELVKATSLRYSELKPADIEANSFMYHLNELIKCGLVEKINRRYTLTDAGKAISARYSMKLHGLRLMPKVVSVIMLEDKVGRLLFYESIRQPLIGQIGFPSGKVHVGESLRSGAYREIAEKCKLPQFDIDLTLRGNFSIARQAQAKDKLSSHLIGYIWYARVDSDMSLEDHVGRTFWSKFEDLDQSLLATGVSDIIDAVRNRPEMFVLDLCY